MPASYLNDVSRARSLARLSGHRVDVLVVGGGITGAGVALDAASRGLRVGLVEAGDFASGTSAYSSKLIHGGLRYLAKGDFGLAWESALERRRLMTTIAPHLVRPLGFVVPRPAAGPRGEFLLAELGIRIADGIRRATGLPGSVLPRPRRITAAALTARVPGIAAGYSAGGVLYWDGQVDDDTRLVTAVLRTAAAHGAHIVRDARAVSLSDRDASVIDERTGQLHRLRAGVVINATGVWAGDFEPTIRIMPSRGTHLVFRSEALGNPTAAYTIPVPGKFGRFVFVLPQPNGLCYFGLTDELDETADGHAPAVPHRDIAFLLDRLNSTLETPVTERDVVGTFAGLRPLIRTGPEREPRPTAGQTADQTADASRHHVVCDPPGGPITVIGGKMTTYRRMAQDTVDAAVGRLRGVGPEPAGARRIRARSATARLPLVGADPAHDRAAAHDPIPDRFTQRYGTEAATVRALAGSDAGLLEPIIPGSDFTGCDVIFAVRAEGASTAADILNRRSRIGLIPDDALAAEPIVNDLIDRANRTLADERSE